MNRNTETEFKRLHRLGDQNDYEVVDNDPDVRGWNVYSSDKALIGRVDELIVDTESKRVVYLDMIVDINFATGEKQNHLLIPMESITIPEETKDVIVNDITSQDLTDYPVFSGSEIPSEYEESLKQRLMNRKRNNPPM